jgi:hypothetical protein
MCTNKAETHPVDYYFLLDARLSKSKYGLDILEHFKFCANCFSHLICLAGNNEYHYYDYKAKKLNTRN